MNVECVRALLLNLPHVVETEQFAGLVFWVGDKAIGGKMFATLDLGDAANGPIWYPAGPERFHLLLEREGFSPAPYLARIYWVAVERWDVLRDQEWQKELSAAHALTLAKLAPGARKVLALPKAEQKRAIAARRKVLAERAAGKIKSGKKRTRSKE